MFSMETVIVLLALAAGAAGSLVLLSCLASRRAQLLEAFRIQQEIEERERQIRQQTASADESVELAGAST